jgi:hypothetical protein
MTTFTIQISTGQQYTFPREQFVKCFPVGLITDAIQTLQDEVLILAEPSVTPEVMLTLQYILHPSDDFKITFQLQEKLKQGDLYLGTFALTVVAESITFLDVLTKPLTLERYVEMLEEMTKQPKPALGQYFFARFDPSETKTQDQKCLETLVEKRVEATTPFFKRLLQRDVDPSVNNNALLINCLTREQISKAKILLHDERVMEDLDVSGVLLLYIKRGFDEEIIDRLLALLGRQLTITEMLALTIAARDFESPPFDLLIQRGVNMAQFNYGWIGLTSDNIGSTGEFRVFLKYNDFDVSIGSNELLEDAIWDCEWATCRQILQHPRFNPNVVNGPSLQVGISRLTHKAALTELMQVLTMWQKHPQTRPKIRAVLEEILKAVVDKMAQPEPMDFRFGLRALSPNDEAYFVPLPHFD